MPYGKSLKKLAWLPRNRTTGSLEAQQSTLVDYEEENIERTKTKNDSSTYFSNLSSLSINSLPTIRRNNSKGSCSDDIDTGKTESGGRFSLLIGRIGSVTSHSPPPLSEVASIADQFVSMINNGQLLDLYTIADTNCLVVFEGVEYLLESYIEDMKNIIVSFPDFHLSYEEIGTMSSTQAIVVNAQGTGTHTGMPYGFGPYPEIEVNGIRCVNDFEDITFIINEQTNKIKLIKVLTNGSSTGPQGFYRQIGGLF